MDEWGHELDFAREYIFIFPLKDKGHKLFISEECPDDIRKKVLEIWPVVEAEQYRRHAQCIYTKRDYFFD